MTRCFLCVCVYVCVVVLHIIYYTNQLSCQKEKKEKQYYWRQCSLLANYISFGQSAQGWSVKTVTTPGSHCAQPKSSQDMSGHLDTTHKTTNCCFTLTLRALEVLSGKFHYRQTETVWLFASVFSVVLLSQVKRLLAEASQSNLNCTWFAAATIHAMLLCFSYELSSFQPNRSILRFNIHLVSGPISCLLTTPWFPLPVYSVMRIIGRENGVGVERWRLI